MWGTLVQADCPIPALRVWLGSHSYLNWWIMYGGTLIMTPPGSKQLALVKCTTLKQCKRTLAAHTGTPAHQEHWQTQPVKFREVVRFGARGTAAVRLDKRCMRRYSRMRPVSDGIGVREAQVTCCRTRRVSVFVRYAAASPPFKYLIALSNPISQSYHCIFHVPSETCSEHTLGHHEANAATNGSSWTIPIEMATVVGQQFLQIFSVSKSPLRVYSH